MSTTTQPPATPSIKGNARRKEPYTPCASPRPAKEMLQFRGYSGLMPDTVPIGAETVLEVVSPDGSHRFVRVTQSPFLIGRGAETGNHLQLSDRRISRNCAAMVMEANKHYIEDRGQRRGLFVNGEKVESRELQDGDIITFGVDDSYEIVYRSSAPAGENSIPHLLTRMEHITGSDAAGSSGVRLGSSGVRLSKLD